MLFLAGWFCNLGAHNKSKYMRYSIPTFLLLFLLSTLQGTNYYIDATDGDDSNDGLTPATAWQTLSSLTSITFDPQPGDTIFLQRGETWRVDPLQVLFSGLPDAPITFTNYGAATDSLPLITSIATLPGSDLAGSWTEVSPGIWSMDLDLNPSRVLLNQQEVLVANSLAEVGTTDAVGALSKWFWADDSTFYLQETMNPALAYGTGIEGSQSPISVFGFFSSHLVFDGLDIEGGSLYSVALFSVDSSEVKNCKIGRNAAAGVGILGNIFGGPDDPSTRVMITDNLIDSGFEITHGPGAARGCRSGLQIILSGEFCTISGNVFRNWAETGFDLQGASPLFGGANNNLFENNHISAPGTSFSRGFSLSGAEGRCSGNRLFRNTIDSVSAGSFINGNNNVIEHNIFSNVRQAVALEAPSAYGVIAAVLTEGFVSHDNNFDHNLVLNTDEAGLFVLGLGATDQATDHNFRNNIFYNNAQNPFGGFYPAGLSLLIDEEESGPQTYQNNILFSDSGNTNSVGLPATGILLSAAAFNATDGQNGNTISANLDLDPGLTDVASGNYLPNTFGNAADAGLDLGYLVDFVLADRFQGVAPDIGPLESSHAVPSELGVFTAGVISKTAVALAWTTLTETATDRFYIERRSAERGWTEIGAVAAAGYAREVLNYEFIDDHAPVGNLYYRLRQADLDGSYTYSPIRQVNLAGESIGLRWTSRHTAVLELPSDLIPEQVTTSFHSVDGRTLPLQRNGTQLTFSTDLPTGIYLLVVNGEAVKIALP